MDLMFVGLAILITEDKKNADRTASWTEGEIVFLDPAPQHATPEEKANAGRHNPVLVVRDDEVSFVGGRPQRTFPLQGAIKPEWLGLPSLDGFTGISLRRSVAYALGVDGKDITCSTNASAGQAFKTIDFVPSLNDFQPGLRLSTAWRDSPHITTRFILGAGEVGSDEPMQGSVKHLKFVYGHQPDSQARHYSDVIRYAPKTTPTAIVIDHFDSRTVVELSEHTRQVWFMNLDDNRSDPTYDHFMLFGLLPWNFTAPRVLGALMTGGDCLGARYHLRSQ